jgi:hypothetical protein
VFIRAEVVTVENDSSYQAVFRCGSSTLQKEASMIAYCGINCDECPAYKGTITGDETLLAKMNKEFGDGKTDATDFVCLGCKYSDLKLIATDCSRCTIRSCAEAKGRDFCSTCDEYETCE